MTIEEREAHKFDEKAAKEHQRSADAVVTPCTAPIILKPDANELCGWPIQMRLVRPWAPCLKGASLLVAGDCTAFAYPAIQQDFIKGRVALVGCPKLDDTAPFVDSI